MSSDAGVTRPFRGMVLICSVDEKSHRVCIAKRLFFLFICTSDTTQSLLDCTRIPPLQQMFRFFGGRTTTHTSTNSSPLTPLHKRPPDLALPLASPANSSPNLLPIHSPNVIVVIIGFTPEALGNTLASATYNPRVPHTLPRVSTTLVLGEDPILHVPI